MLHAQPLPAFPSLGQGPPWPSQPHGPRLTSWDLHARDQAACSLLQVEENGGQPWQLRVEPGGCATVTGEAGKKDPSAYSKAGPGSHSAQPVLLQDQGHQAVSNGNHTVRLSKMGIPSA